MIDDIQFTEEQKAVIYSEENRLCVFACAGSGKTFTITNRIADLINKKGISPNKIAAITFTNLATESLKKNLITHLEDPQSVSRVFIGTIHSFCMNLLKKHEGFTLEENQILTQSQQFIICSQNFDLWGLDKLGNGIKSSIIESFLATVSIVKMEQVSMETLKSLQPELEESFSHYDKYLKDNLKWDFSDLITTAFTLLNTNEDFKREVCNEYDYLFVDEYQDVDPTQANIVEILATSMKVCIVGDDDQSIYQFRGTDVRNILNFANDGKTKTFHLSTNRRCPKNVLTVANNCIVKVSQRQEKDMNPLQDNGRVETSQFNDLNEEYAFILNKIEELRDSDVNFKYSDIAILMRSVASYGLPYIQFLKSNSIPVVVTGGRNLFENREIKQLVQILNWMIPDETTINSILDLNITFSPDLSNVDPGKNLAEVTFVELGLQEEDFQLLTSLLTIKEKYQLSKYGSILELIHLIIGSLDLINSQVTESVQYHIGQLTGIASEYDEVSTSKRLERFCGFIVSYAQRSYDEVTPPSEYTNAINVITIHQAKGLEYKYVFVPMMVNQRFPVTSNNNRWTLDNSLFDSIRYMSSVENERRLFYVAVTRAKSGLFLTASKDVGLIRDKVPSIFFNEVRKVQLEDPNQFNTIDETQNVEKNFLVSSYSSLEYYLTCPYRYKLIKVIGIKSPLNPFFEFGKLIHYLVALINIKAEDADLDEIIEIYDDLFSKTTANKHVPALVIAKQKIRGRTAIKNYFDNKRDWYTNITSSEEDFEFVADGCLIRGRFDAISQNKNGSYHIIDIKTGSPHDYLRTDFQMQLYSLAATKHLGINVSKATLYYIERDMEISYDVGNDFLKEAETNLSFVVSGILNENYHATPGKMCTRCEMSKFCEYK